VSTGETIQGTFKEAIADPDNPDITSADFTTQRPTFAEDDLLQRLIDNDVV
ncbi:MAG: hypothetical protein GWN48_07110, partial [Actinobacteria bacterium]|nr:hypothetical protein [Actinomycetota bacterium]